MKILGITITTIIYVLFVYQVFTKYSADKNYVMAQNYAKDLNFENALESAKTSIRKVKEEPRYYYELARIQLAYANMLPPENKKTIKEEALLNLKKAENLNPENLVSLKNMIPLYYFLSININADGKTEIDKHYIQHTRNFYERGMSFSQSDVGIFTLLVKYENLLQLYDLQNISVEKIKELRPDLLEWYISIPQ